LQVPADSGRRSRPGRARAHRALKRAACVRDGLLRPHRGVVFLCYHRVGEQSSATEIDLPTDLFAAQMASVARRGPQTIEEALDALRVRGWLHGDRVVVSFDDGTADFVDIALPILVEHRVPAVLYVATDFVESQREFPHGGKPLSWAAIRDALSTGLVTVGSHTHSHALLDRVDAATAADELDRSIELLYERTEIMPAHFAYPKALAGNEVVHREVRKRFRSAAVAGTRPNRYGTTDPWLLARSPIQRADGIEFFERKLRGGLRLEDDVRRLANRVRYVGARA
jgi:peptidoglycan/xylan/chitin deacetylase (PgdA/CDA1 family)